MKTSNQCQFQVYRSRNKSNTTQTKMKFNSNYLFIFAFLALLAVDLSGGQPKDSPLSGSPGVLLRDILYGASELKETISNGEERDAVSGLQAPDVGQLLAALESRGMSEERGESPEAKFILQLYERLQAGESLVQASGRRETSLRQADTVRTFTVSENGNEQNKRTVEFRITSLSSEIPKLAELRLTPIRHQGQPKSQGFNKLRVVVYGQNGEQVLRTSYRTPYKYDRKSGYNLYDITPVIEDIASIGVANVTVKVTLNLHRNKNPGERQKRSMQSVVEDNDKAVLVIYSQDTKFFNQLNAMKGIWERKQNTGTNLSSGHSRLRNSRPKRATNNKKNGNRKSLCERKDFYVDFEELEWGEWIVYPKRFNAYMCSGKCPSPVDQPFTPTNHAVMQSLMRLARRGNGGQPVPRPCCVPSKLHPISMLYYEYGEIVVRHHEQMIVDECGCR